MMGSMAAVVAAVHLRRWADGTRAQGAVVVPAGVDEIGAGIPAPAGSRLGVARADAWRTLAMGLRPPGEGGVRLATVGPILGPFHRWMATFRHIAIP